MVRPGAWGTALGGCGLERRREEARWGGEDGRGAQKSLTSHGMQ